MSAGQSRLEIFVDVLDLPRQRALIVPAMTGEELVQEVLQEFRTLGYLSTTPADYQLLKATNKFAVEPALPLDQQLSSHECLILVERERAVPTQVQRPSRYLYLCEEATGKVYKLHWLPAIIGRADVGSQQTSLLAVDLSAHERGLRVSRSHAQIIEEQGQCYIQSLSSNPTTIKNEQGQATQLDPNKHQLSGGEIIYLDNSQIALRFVVREKERLA